MIRGAVVFLAMAVTSTARADVAVEIRCPSAAPPETVAALGLELDAATDASVVIDATPCDGASPLQITIAAGGQRMVLGAVLLPERERARAIALLIADLVEELEEMAARAPAGALPAAPTHTPTPATTPPPMAADVAIDALAVTSPAERTVLPLGLAATFAITHRAYDEWGTIGDGARMSVSRTLAPALHAGASAELDESRTRHGFSLRTTRGGVQLGGRARWHGASIVAGARAEVGHSSVLPELMTQSLRVRSPWTAAAAGIAEGEVALFGSVALHASLESGATVHSRAIFREFTNAEAPPGDDLAVVAGRYWSVAVGLTLR